MFIIINLFGNIKSRFIEHRKTYLTTIAGFLSLIVVSANASAEDAPRLVQLGDTIEIRMSSMDQTDNLIPVSWRQKGKRTRTYLQTAGKVRYEGGLSFVNIFIEEGFLPDFKSECVATSETICSLTVAPDFQYGQDSEQTIRFLVYHNQSNCPYQHRFMTTTTAAKFGEAANELASSAGEIGQDYIPMAKQASDAFNQMSGLAKSAFGDYLHNMSGGNTCR